MNNIATRIILVLLVAALGLGLAAQNAKAQAWTRPADNANQPAGDPLKLPEVQKMPDVVGVRPGMSPQEALQTLHKQDPSDRYQEMKVDWWPSPQKPDYGFNILAPDPLGTPDAYLSFTAPPNRQVVWRIVRYTHRINVNRATLLAALREKYGRESYAGAENGSPVRDDRAIGQLLWLFDEHGGRAPLPAAQALPNGIYECASVNSSQQPVMPRSDDEIRTQFRDVCSSFVVLHVSIGSTEIVADTVTELIDAPLAIRTAHAADLWQRAGAERARQDAIEKSKQNKPARERCRAAAR